jgi:hypothetical protein
VFIVLPLHAEAPARGIPPRRSVATAAQGRAAMFGACKALKMKENGNHAFRFPC